MADLDLNLLRPLHALLEERSVTRAAGLLHLSQPATSAALARLRRHYDDALLVRDGRGMRLTPFARDLRPAVAHAIEQLRPVTDRKVAFEPRTTERRFVIGATDYMVAMLAGPLVEAFEREAPGASAVFMPYLGGERDAAPYATFDVIVGPVGFGIPGESSALFTDDFVLIADAEHPALRGDAPTLGDLAGLRYASAYLTGPDQGDTEAFMRRVGLEPMVGARLFGLATLPLVVAGSRLVALVPRMLAAAASRTLRLATFELPDELAIPMAERLFWHARDTADPAIEWLRDIVSRTVASLSREPSGPVPRRLGRGGGAR